MSEPKFTPGPWTAQRDGAHFGSLSVVIGGELTKNWPNRRLLVHVGGSAPLEEQEANTFLIEAATDMYEALKTALTALESIEAKALVGDEGCIWPAEIVRAALAKAVKP